MNKWECFFLKKKLYFEASVSCKLCVRKKHMPLVLSYDHMNIKKLFFTFWGVCERERERDRILYVGDEENGTHLDAGMYRFGNGYPGRQATWYMTFMIRIFFYSAQYSRSRTHALSLSLSLIRTKHIHTYITYNSLKTQKPIKLIYCTLWHTYITYIYVYIQW